MPMYLFKAKYSVAAIKAMVDKPQDREPPARKLIEAAGGKLHHLFFAFSEDDAFVLIEAPNDETMAGIALTVAASGAFSGGSTTKLMSTKDAMKAMEMAHGLTKSYVPATG